MAILDELNARYKQAMKAREQQAVDTIRMVRARLDSLQNEKDFDGELTDEVVQNEIVAYVKQLKKALPEYENAGASGAEMMAKLQFEIDYLAEFLPALMDEAATRAAVEGTIQKLGVSDPKRAGQVMGAIMKEHKGQVDPALVRRLVDQTLNPTD